MSNVDLIDGPKSAAATEPAAEQISEGQFNEQLAELAKQWGNARDNDLEVRHRTGQLLNERYGKPDKRQKRGPGVLLAVVQQLGVAQSELSRMRRFAFHFTSAADMKGKHPDVVTWTAVKTLLTTLKPAGEAKGTSKTGAASSPKPKASNANRLKKIKLLLDALPTDVREIHKGLSEAEKKELMAKFEVAATAITDCLKVSVEQEKVSSESAPSAQMAG